MESHCAIFSLRRLDCFPGKAARRTGWAGLLRFCGSRRNTTPTLSIPGGLSLRHGITLVLGESGSGKSVLLSFLAGYPLSLRNMRYSCERLSVGGRQADKAGRHSYSPAALSRTLCKAFLDVPCIYLPQRFPNVPRGVFKVRTVMKQLVWATLSRRRLAEIQVGRRDGSVRKEIRELLRRRLREAGLLHLWEKDLSLLSGGERQRIELLTRLVALRLSSAPKSILLLDEPTTGLDAVNSRLFFDLLRRELVGNAKQGHLCSVIVSTHEPDAIRDAEALPLITIANEAPAIGSSAKQIVATQHESVREFLREHGGREPDAKVWEDVYRLLGKAGGQQR